MLQFVKRRCETTGHCKALRRRPRRAKSVGEQERGEMLGARGNSERWSRTDGAVVLGLRGALRGLLASDLQVAGEGVTVGTELAYSSCQPENKALV